MKLLLLLSFIYQFYYSSLEGNYILPTTIEICDNTIEVTNRKGLITYEILEELASQETNTGTIRIFRVLHKGQTLNLELNTQYCFIRGNEEEVYSNFEVKLIKQ